jgi:hypothetical protein
MDWWIAEAMDFAQKHANPVNDEHGWHGRRFFAG